MQFFNANEYLLQFHVSNCYSMQIKIHASLFIILYDDIYELKIVFLLINLMCESTYLYLRYNTTERNRSQIKIEVFNSVT